jgi:N-acetylglucosaminyldiphosphoundecaprenol N-acetyl-beta-D-mannosaminyltransferase
MTEQKINIFNLPVNPVNQEKANELILNYDFSGKPGYVCFPNTFVVTEAQKNKKIVDVNKASNFSFPDGKPLIYYLKKNGFNKVQTVSGYWMMDELLRTSHSHFFYGTNEKTLNILQKEIKKKYPIANVLGYKAPPLVTLENIADNKEIEDDIHFINQLQPDYIWVGLNSPKQDYLMYHYHEKLKKGLMLGVGAVFNYMAGTEKKSPEWIKKIGFRWLYRLLLDPKKHFKKYLYSNSCFIYLLLKDKT